MDYNYKGIIDGMMLGTLREATAVTIEDVLFREPATIVFWSDGTKTVVKCHDEKFDKEKGLAMAIIKKILGNTGSYYELFKDFIEEEE